jgi:hypothetical protein
MYGMVSYGDPHRAWHRPHRHGNGLGKIYPWAEMNTISTPTAFNWFLRYAILVLERKIAGLTELGFHGMI